MRNPNAKSNCLNILLTSPAFTLFTDAFLIAGHFNLNNMTQTENIAEIELVYKPSISNKPIISSPLDAYNVFMDFLSNRNIASTRALLCSIFKQV